MAATLIRFLGRARLTLALAAPLLPQLASAASCGDDDCGPHGSCRLSSLVPRCDCDEGYATVSTFRAPSSMGAYCVPLGAPPGDVDCAPIDCQGHGVCVVQSGDAGNRVAQCTCDPGYRTASEGGCEDDPDDDSEAVCDAVECTDGMTCMATSDAVTCRCSNGGDVVLGAGVGGGFGPVCSTPPDPATACGPDACGPYGRCVISQAVFCDCDEGTGQEDRAGPDGKQHPYCVRPGEPLPLPDAGNSASDAGPVTRVDAGTPPKKSAASKKGGGCQSSRGPADSLPPIAPLVGTMLTLLTSRRRRTRAQCRRGETGGR